MVNKFIYKKIEFIIIWYINNNNIYIYIMNLHNSVIHLKLNINNIKINILTTQLKQNNAIRCNQMNNLNIAISNISHENIIIVGDMKGDYDICNNLIDHTPNENTYISILNNTRKLDKILSNMNIDYAIADDTFGSLDDNYYCNHKVQVSCKGVNEYVNNFFSLYYNNENICSRDFGHRCNNCYLGIKLNYLNNNDIPWFKHVLKLNNKLSSHSPIITKTNGIIIVQWNIMAKLKHNCYGFCSNDVTFIMNPLRINNICDKIKKYNPDVICLQDVDTFSFLTCITKFTEYSPIHRPHVQNNVGVAMFVRNGIGIEDYNYFFI